MIVVKTVYVKRLPPKDTCIHLVSACSSCSAAELKKDNPSPDLHYFEMFWFSKAVGGVQKNVLRLLYPSYRMAVEEHDKMFQRLFGNTKDWIDDYYLPQIEAMKQEILISKENRKILEDWKAKYDAYLKKGF